MDAVLCWVLVPVRQLLQDPAGPDTWVGPVAGVPWPGPCRASCGLRREAGGLAGRGLEARALEQALGIYRDLGERLGQAGALLVFGSVRRMTGDYPAAARALEEALGIFRDLGDRGGEAGVLNETGTLHRVGGDLARAEDCHRQALDLARQIGSSWDEAHALAGLGRCAQAADDSAGAEDMLRQALEIFQRIGAPEATDVSGELGALVKAGPTG